MAILRIPTRNDIPFYTLRIELEGVLYILNIRYNERMDLWAMDILNDEELPVVSGVLLLTGVPLLNNIVKEGLPPGDFFLLDRQDNDRNATRELLGDEVNLFYRESESA